MLLVSQRTEVPRMEPYLTLQGSIKRKLGDDGSPVSSGMNDLIFPSDHKRLCLDDVTLSMGQSQNTSSNVSCSELQNSPFANHGSSSIGVSGHPGLLENNHLNGRGMASPYSVSQNTEMGPKYEEKESNLQSVDQELQDLLEELTKMPDPSPNELDLEKILGGGSKADEPIVISHSQPSLSTTPKLSPQTASHLDNHVSNKEFSAGCNPGSAGSPQIRPSSTGTNYSVTSTNKPVQSPIPSAQSKSQSQPMLPVSMTNMPGANWHAQQLKQLAASKQGTSTKQQVQPTNWPTISPTGLSPPYRSGSSPQQPFSPPNVLVSGMSTSSLQGNNIQGSQNPLLSSMSTNSNPTSRPSPPYVSEKISSPALNQQPFSPQNQMLPNMSSNNIPTNTIKSPPNNLVSSMAPTTAGPSPPYQPEKLSSPALHQQPFSPQNPLMPSITPSSNQPNMQSSLFKSMSNNQPKNINMIMQQPSNGLQQGLVNETPVGHDQFSFNNTKPLSHFAPDSAAQKMNLSPSSGSLIHYLQQQQQQHQNPAVQQPPPQQVSNSQFLQQQIRQLMQPSRMQRQMQQSGLPAQARQDPNPGMIPRMQEPGSVPNPGPGQTPPTANGYIRNAILKEQIMRRQLMQVKHRPNMMGVLSEQRSAFVAQQMNQFQTLPQPLRTDCVQPMSTPPQSHRMITSTQGQIQNSMGSGIPSSTINQNSGSLVMIPHNTGKLQGVFPSSTDFNIPLRQNHNTLSMAPGCQTVHSQPTVRPGMALSGYTPSSLNQSAAQQHLRQSNISRIPNVYANSTSQMWTQAAVSRIPSQNQLDPGMQQFPNNPLFSKQNVRPNMASQQFSHQNVVPPNQIAPGVQLRQMQKLGLAQANQGVGALSSSSLGNSISRGQLADINAMKAMPQGVTPFNQINTGQLGPPSYAASSVQTPETFERMGSGADLHPYDFGPAHNNSVLSANCNEADFIDCLMKGGPSNSTDEDWLNNLTMLDDILGQHAQNPGPV